MFYHTFHQRGHPKRPLREAYQRALNTPRLTLLSSHRDEFIICIGNFDTYAQEVRTILRKLWNILRADTDLMGVLPTYPCVTYRRGKNHLKTTTSQGSDRLRSPNRGLTPVEHAPFVLRFRNGKHLPIKLKIINFSTVKRAGLYIWSIL